MLSRGSTVALDRRAAFHLHHSSFVFVVVIDVIVIVNIVIFIISTFANIVKSPEWQNRCHDLNHLPSGTHSVLDITWKLLINRLNTDFFDITHHIRQSDMVGKWGNISLSRNVSQQVTLFVVVRCRQANVVQLPFNATASTSINYWTAFSINVSLSLSPLIICFRRRHRDHINNVIFIISTFANIVKRSEWQNRCHDLNHLPSGTHSVLDTTRKLLINRLKTEHFDILTDIV